MTAVTFPFPPALSSATGVSEGQQWSWKHCSMQIQLAWLQKKTSSELQGQRVRCHRQPVHKEAADFCAWYFWAGIFSHISLMNKMVVWAEKQRTATRKQKATCRLCKDWKAKMQAPAITFTTVKHCCRSDVEGLTLPLPHSLDFQFKRNKTMLWAREGY